jgi:hypothetical protein
MLQPLADGEAVLLDLTSGKSFGLNATGARMWAALTEATSVGASLDLLQREFRGVHPDRLAEDLLELIDHLCECGLLEMSHG